MSIIEELASQRGSRGDEDNAAVAKKCQSDARSLAEIVAHLSDRNTRLAGDCAEVLTKLAESAPEQVSPFVEELEGLLQHKNGRVRWEAAHAYSLIAPLQVPRLRAKVEVLAAQLNQEQSVIVRDYLLDTFLALGRSGRQDAERVLTILEPALQGWQTKHAARILTGLLGILDTAPELGARLAEIAEPFLAHERAGVRKAAQRLQKRCARGGKG